MTKSFNVRIAAFTSALAMTMVVHGTMLWTFDSVAQQANLAQQKATVAHTAVVASGQS